MRSGWVLKLLDVLIIGLLAAFGVLLIKRWRASPNRDENASRAAVAKIEASFPGGFPAWLREQSRGQRWAEHGSSQLKLEPKTIEASIDLGRAFLLSNQKPAGNFNYSYDFVARRFQSSDHQVRQAGALWVLALLNQQRSDAQVRSALDRALKFFLNHTRASSTNGGLAIAYPDAAECQSGTVALVALAITEHLCTPRTSAEALTAAQKSELQSALDGYLRHLEFMRLQNEHFARSWSWSKQARDSAWDPYDDGECLLCFVKAAKRLGYSRLVPEVEECMAHLARHYTVGQWTRRPDSQLTEGFFQWGCMALWEYRDTGWKEAQTADDYLLQMGWWMTHTHDVLSRTGNTAADFEGLIHCWLAAKEARNLSSAQELAWTIDQGLNKLLSWQIGGPLQRLNPFLSSHPTNDPLAVGGFLGQADDPILRIDVSLHQLHALLLARQHLQN